jgi:hypothetical protein
MTPDIEGAPLEGKGGTLRAFFMAAILLASGLALMGWENRNDQANAMPLPETSQGH